MIRSFYSSKIGLYVNKMQLLDLINKRFSISTVCGYVCGTQKLFIFFRLKTPILEIK